MMKYSSTKMAPNGRIPVKNSDGTVFKLPLMGGIWRGIWLVFVGPSIIYMAVRRLSR